MSEHQPLSILFLGNYIKENAEKDPRFFPYADFVKNHSGHHVDFTPKENKIYDATIVFNTVLQEKQLKNIAGNVFALMQEPGEGLVENPYMFLGLEQYDKVFSPIVQSENTIQSIPYLGWYLQKTYTELLTLPIPQKDKQLSCVMSNLRRLKGHKLRYDFVKNYLKPSGIEVDFYGRNINPIEKKEDALLRYNYSIAIENSSKDFYFTEKIEDCFCCYTVPFYYGCKNIDKFFPKQSYVHIDIERPEYALQTIKEELESNRFSERMPYLQEARELVLKKYNVVGFIKQLEPLMYENKDKGEVNTYKIKPIHFPLYERAMNRGQFLPIDLISIITNIRFAKMLSIRRLLKFVIKCLIFAKV